MQFFAALTACLVAFVAAQSSYENPFTAYLTQTNSLGVVTGQPTVVTTQPKAITTQPKAITTQPALVTVATQGWQYPSSALAAGSVSGMRTVAVPSSAAIPNSAASTRSGTPTGTATGATRSSSTTSATPSAATGAATVLQVNAMALGVVAMAAALL